MSLTTTAKLTATPTPTGTPTATETPTATPTPTATAEGSGYQSSGMPAMAAPALLDYQAPMGMDPQSGIGAQSSALVNRTITYTYDPLNRLTVADYNNGTYFHYAYDEVGNRISMTGVTPGDGNLTTSFTYNAANQLTERTVSDGRAYTYDWSPNGEMTTEWTQGVAVRTFAYNPAGQMVEATVFELITQLAYNGLGNRLSVAVDGQGTTTNVLDLAAGDRILSEQTGTEKTTYLYGHDSLGQFEDEWLFYLKDVEGLTRQGIDDQGEIVSAWQFDPDGSVIEGPEGPVSHLVCEGVYDWSTGLIYKGGHYFDPMLGIWLVVGGLVVFQGWPSRKKKNHKHRNISWLGILLLTIAVSGTLAACGTGEMQKITETAICTEEHMVTFGPTKTFTITPKPETPTPKPSTTPQFVGEFSMSAYYIPTEEMYRNKGGAKIPIPAVRQRSIDLLGNQNITLYLSKTHKYDFAWNTENLRKAIWGFLYDKQGVCTQGGGKLDSGEYISCTDPCSTLVEEMRFDWQQDEKVNRLEYSVKKFETIAVPPEWLYILPYGTEVEIPELEPFMAEYNKDTIFTVRDTGGGLSTSPPTIDLFVGEGATALDPYYRLLNMFPGTETVRVYRR